MNNIHELKELLLKLRYVDWKSPIVVEMPDDKSRYAVSAVRWDVKTQSLVVEVA